MNKHLINNLKHIMQALVLVLLASTNASAAIHLSDHLYFGLGVAQSDLQVNKQNVAALNNLSNQSSLEDNGFGMQTFLGIKFDEHVALELGYVDMGAVNLNDGTTVQEFMEAKSIYIDSVLSQRVTNWLDVFAKVGVSFWQAQDLSNNEKTDGDGMHYGAGFDIDLVGNRARVMRIKWEHHEFDNVILKSTDSISASLMFNF